MIFRLCSASAQTKHSSYEEALKAYESEDYNSSIEKFQLAIQEFKKQNDITNTIKCLSYISKIYSLKNNYEASINETNRALDLLKQANTGVKDSLFSELMSGKALSLKFLGAFDKAFVVSDSLVRYFKNNNHPEYLSNAYQIRSRVEIDLGKYDSAILSAKKALVQNADVNQERSAALLNIIGVGFYFKEQLDSASLYYDASYKMKQEMGADNYQLAIATCNIGIVQEMLGEYDKAIELYKKSVQYDLLDRGEEVGILSDVYVALSNTYFKKNDFEQSEEYANKALRIAIKKYGEDSPQTSFVYVSYANIFEMQGDYEKNIEYLKKALDIRRKTYGNKHRWTAESLLSIAEAQIELQQFTKAEKNYKEAIDIAETNNNKVLSAYAQTGLGTIYTKTNQFEFSEITLQKAKENFKTIYGEFHNTHLNVLVREAENFVAQGNLNEALKLIQIVKKNASETNLFYNLDASTLELDIALQLYSNGINPKLLKDKIDNLDKAKAMLLAIQRDYPTNTSKIHVNNSMNDFISKAIQGAYLLYQNSKDSNYIEKAFMLSELNRSSTLVSGVQDARFKQMANVSQELLDKENELNYKLASLKKDVYYEENAEEPDESYLNDVYSNLLSTRNSLDSLLNRMESDYPKYYQLKYNHETVTVNQLQTNVLSANETLLEYFVADNKIYVFVVTTTEADFIALENGKQILNKVKNYRQALDIRETLSDLATGLYDALLNEINLNTERLIIIPDKELNHLPFETLKKEDRFLIEDIIISYSGSASLLKTQKEDFFDFNFKTTWSGFAPSFNSNTSLSSNQLEIDLVAKLMRGKAFKGNMASLENFRKSSQNSSVLHLATHGQLDKYNPMFSKLIFSQDSSLTASDIYSLKINAEMAVLSACETGFGKIEKSEGVMSMARAFQYAGVKSTVMSLWKVPDKETSLLMESFYKNLKKGESKDEALQMAKIDYLKTTKDPILKHPFYWSGFIISGDVEPIYSSNNRLVLIIGIGFILLLLVFGKHLIKRVK